MPDDVKNLLRQTWYAKRGASSVCCHMDSHWFTALETWTRLTSCRCFFCFFFSNNFLREFPEIFTVKGSNPCGAPCAAPQPESRSDEPPCWVFLNLQISWAILIYIYIYIYYIIWCVYIYRLYVLFFNGLDMFQNPTCSNDDVGTFHRQKCWESAESHHLSLVKPSEADGYGIGYTIGIRMTIGYTSGYTWQFHLDPISLWQVSFFGYDDLWHEMDRQIEETPMPLECRLEYVGLAIQLWNSCDTFVSMNSGWLQNPSCQSVILQIV